MTTTAPARTTRTIGLLVAGLGAGVAADVFFDPVTRHVPLCPMHSVTGLWCPVCGGLRATYELAHGRIGTAWHDNVLLVAAVPLAALWLLDQLWRARRGQPARRPTRPMIIAAVTISTVFTVLRNLPGFGFLSP
jgi:hypothetical protein